MAAIPQVSPLKKVGGTSSRVVVTTTTGSTTGGVPAHQHDAAAVISGRFPDARLRTSLATFAPLASDLNSVLTTGWVSANNVTSNTPAASFWNVQCIYYGADTTTGNFVTQVAYEVAGAYRVFRRTLNVVTWTAWEAWDAPSTRQVYELPMLLAGVTTAVCAASATVGTECFVSTKMSRKKVDLTNATQIRLGGVCLTNSSAGSIQVSYMTTEAGTWAGTAAGASISVSTGTTGIVRDSGWQTLAVGARVADVTIAVSVSVAVGGTAPMFGSLSAFIR